jgi:hypothetical protein
MAIHLDNVYASQAGTGIPVNSKRHAQVKAAVAKDTDNVLGANVIAAQAGWENHA